MIQLLCIETSSDVCSVCISQSGSAIGCQTISTPKAHASQLAILINKLLNELQLDIKALNGIAYSAGPGSYSGLRIGLSLAQGLCYGSSLPLIAVNTLQALATQAQQFYKKNNDCVNKIQFENVVYISITDARQEVYFAVYDHQLNEIEPPQSTKLSTDTFKGLANYTKIFCGSGVHTQQHLFPTHNTICLTAAQCYYDASNLAALSYDLYRQKKYEDIAYTMPYYLKIATYNQINNFYPLL